MDDIKKIRKIRSSEILESVEDISPLKDRWENCHITKHSPYHVPELSHFDKRKGKQRINSLTLLGTRFC